MYSFMFTSTMCCPENPISDEGEYRLEVLTALRRLERLDKDEFTEEERQEAQDNYEQRKTDELAQVSVLFKTRDPHQISTVLLHINCIIR